MTEIDIEKIIEKTVNATVVKLKMSGLMKDGRKTAYQKTEELLKNYMTFCQIEGQPYTRKLVDIIDKALGEIESDAYFEIIPMFYFRGKTRENLAEYFDTSERTITRNKNRLVNKLKTILFSDDVIYELFL